MSRILRLGSRRSISGQPWGHFDLRADDLTKHLVVVGSTGSGKTGLLSVLIEETLLAGIPVLAADVKGDLANLMLTFPTFDAEPLTPWIDPEPGDPDGIADPPVVQAAADQRERELRAWDIHEERLRAFAEGTHIRVITPGSDAGEPLHLLSALERRSARWDTDIEGARANLATAVSMVLGLIGRESNPGKSREHALLCAIAEARLSRGADAVLEELIPEIVTPPMETLGALPMEVFFAPKQRMELAADLNTLVASSSFASYRRGQDLDVGKWMAPVDGKTPCTIVNVAHLDDHARPVVLGQVLEHFLAWVRTLPGTNRLRGLIVFDELYGFLPPHPRSPPTKGPLVSLVKQARAFGIGCVLATQNPMDLDYRALSNAATWALTRLATDADRKRVMEALGEDKKKSPVADLVKRLSPRWFIMRDAKTGELSLLHPRWAIALLRGPMTPQEIKRSRKK